MFPAERLRFTKDDDILILQQILSLNPYLKKENWEIIKNTTVEVTGKNFTLRAIKDHVEYMLKNWTRTDNASRKRYVFRMFISIYAVLHTLYKVIFYYYIDFYILLVLY